MRLDVYRVGLSAATSRYFYAESDSTDRARKQRAFSSVSVHRVAAVEKGSPMS